MSLVFSLALCFLDLIPLFVPACCTGLFGVAGFSLFGCVRGLMQDCLYCIIQGLWP